LKETQGRSEIARLQVRFQPSCARNQAVQVYLAKQKKATKDKKEAAKVDENEIPPSTRPKVIMIMIMQESAPK